MIADHTNHRFNENLTTTREIGVQAALTLDCHHCALKNEQDQCGDCVVTHLLNLPAPAHKPALVVLIEQGLLPPSKFSQSKAD